MSGFSLSWLRQRAPFDRAARDAALARRFAAAASGCASAAARTSPAMTAASMPGSSGPIHQSLGAVDTA